MTRVRRYVVEVVAGIGSGFQALTDWVPSPITWGLIGGWVGYLIVLIGRALT